MYQYLKQHNAITEARYEMSALEKNILYLLMRKLDELDPPGKEYIVDISLLEKIVGPLTREEIKEATENLIRRSYEIREDQKNTLIVSLMTVVMHDFSTKKLTIKISKNILPYYEMLSQHKDVGEFTISIQELKRRLALDKNGKQKELYTQFATLRRSILEVAQKELKEHPDINFTYEAKKTGKKYTDLTFHIKKVKKTH